MLNYFRLLQYARRERPSLMLISALTLAGAGLVALQPWPMKLLVDHVLVRSPQHTALETTFQRIGWSTSPTAILLIATLGGLLLFALNAAVDAGLTWAWTIAGRRTVYRLAEDLFARLQRRSLLFHKRNAVGDSLSRVTEDSWCVYQVADALFFTPIHALLTTVAMIVPMAALDWRLTLWAVATAPLMVAASFLVSKPLRAAAKLKREIESRIQAHIQQTLTGIPVVQAFGQEERESLRFQKFANTTIRSQQRSALLGSINSFGSGLIATLGSGIILWLGARHVLSGALSIGGILVFLVYLNSLQAQVKVFAGLNTAAQGLSASMSRVVEVLDAAPDLPEKPEAVSLASVRGRVQFERVTAGYEPGRPVLKNVSLDVEPGQTIAIVGATGAGKTTLVNLIPRFMDPWEGCIRIDGRDLREVRLKSLRDHIAMVLQDSFLFPCSIADNIAYGHPTATRSEIEAAARAANAHDFISALPDRYDTVIGERGATLSGGERQRLAIARALLKNPPILILDEPTSALDAETERVILAALERAMKDRTTFVIAHRLSTVRRADRIVVLKDGRIVESGTHQALMAQHGQYACLNLGQSNAVPPVPAGRT